MRLIRWIKVKLQETIKPNISNKSKNILGVDRVEQIIQRRNVEVSLSYHVIFCRQCCSYKWMKEWTNESSMSEWVTMWIECWTYLSSQLCWLDASRCWAMFLHNKHTLGGAVVRRRTRDRKVAGSTPGRGAIKSTTSTQPSIPPG